MDSILTLLHLSPTGWYVLMTVVVVAIIAFIEIYGLKNRRYRVYQDLVREARARRSEMALHID